MANIIRLSEVRRKPRPSFFSRAELNLLLSLYSRQVARGQWRDYAIGVQDGKALFAVFRHSNETALYTVVKATPAGDRGGEFTLMAGRLPLARSASIADLLAGLERKLRARAVPLDGGGSR
ncbi:MAG: DUF2794 domain-containing protein [Stellaceae bacterium]